uniref:Uncharacterized protein n=1 Tax=Setaria digitata TaxID=48799 RepID=A0A915Q2K6_9BILA
MAEKNETRSDWMEWVGRSRLDDVEKRKPSKPLPSLFWLQLNKH